MSKRPNILFLIMDDQRPDTLGAGSSFPVDTPNLDCLTHHSDFMPTLLQAAGIESKNSTDGMDLFTERSVEFLCCGFTSPDADPDKPLRETQRMIVTDEWKLIYYPINGHRSLYHLSSDPNECDDLLAPWRTQDYPLYGYKAPITRGEITSITVELETKLCNWGAVNNDPLFS